VTLTASDLLAEAHEALAAGDFDRALAAVTEAVAAGEDLAAAHRLRGDLLNSDGRYGEA
jgi:cellobiose-specific phosphotransferase system component IIA